MGYEQRIVDKHIFVQTSVCRLLNKQILVHLFVKTIVFLCNIRCVCQPKLLNNEYLRKGILEIG